MAWNTTEEEASTFSKIMKQYFGVNGSEPVVVACAGEVMWACRCNNRFHFLVCMRLE